MTHRILKSDLKLPKASARWVPRLLSVDDANTTHLVTIAKVIRRHLEFK